MFALTVAALVALAAPPQFPAAPDGAPIDSAAIRDSIRHRFETTLHWEQGRVALRGGVATLDLPPRSRFLGPTDAERVLTKAWGNPPGSGLLGMIFPDSTGPFSEGSWAIVVTFDEDGYVKDDEAAKLDYEALLKKMQASSKEENEERAKQGFGTVQLLGWAEQPHYDAEQHKLYWAKQLQFSDANAQTLNYNIRALGRRGVLVLNAVAGMDQLDDVKRGMPQILSAVNFTDGNRYTDFNPSQGDKVAAYGIAALIAGGVAAKAGMFKLLIAALIAAKKVVVIAVVAIGAWLRRFFGRRKERAAASLPGAPPSR